MDRVLENLLCFQGNGFFPSKLVFTLLTPRIFKQTYGSRLYSYKFKEYSSILGTQNGCLANRIKLKSDKKTRDNNWQYPTSLEERLNHLTLNWVTFEDLIELELNNPNIKGLNLTKLDDAKILWNAAYERIIQD
ncbi:hypothetical protein HYG86_04930 [Alkalicella caledoniensis]|uniref:Uncharacterized protein n=1 Tax=Alkalicella caledoniensis TaxID=2731377 RepID=A0A7G9W648_ALKCA|nr:hypothetical protein [Alkalicella caledoniensis]QNO14160.1 hypothetical protein HYG86_04930 [Alkalicella caledoniensis]